MSYKKLPARSGELRERSGVAYDGGQVAAATASSGGELVGQIGVLEADVFLGYAKCDELCADNARYVDTYAPRVDSPALEAVFRGKHLCRWDVVAKVFRIHVREIMSEIFRLDRVVDLYMDMRPQGI